MIEESDRDVLRQRLLIGAYVAHQIPLDHRIDPADLDDPLSLALLEALAATERDGLAPTIQNVIGRYVGAGRHREFGIENAKQALQHPSLSRISAEQIPAIERALQTARQAKAVAPRAITPTAVEVAPRAISPDSVESSVAKSVQGEPAKPRNQRNPQNDPGFCGFADSADRDSFPVNAFPLAVRELVEGVAAARLVPEPMVSAAVLGIASAACGAGIRLVTPLGELPPNLFIVVAAETGVGKDSTLGPIAEPLREIERELETAFIEREMPELLADRKLADDKLRAKGAKAPTASEVRDLTVELAAIDRRLRARPQVIVNDSTAQALAEVMSRQPGEAIASVTSEGRGPLSIILGKYSERGKAGDEDFFAGAFSGTPRTVNRRGRGPAPEVYRLNRPCLTVLWFLQPDAYRAALAEPSMLDSGFLCRPLSFDSHAEPALIPPEGLPPIPVGPALHWRRRIREMAEVFRAGGDDPQRVRLSPEAETALREFGNECVLARRNDGSLRDVAGVVARWAENAARVALVLHALDHGKNAPEHPMSGETAESAIRMVQWFAREVLAMLAENRESRRESRLNRLLNLLARKGGEITLRTLRDNHGFAEAEVERLADADGKIEVIEANTDGPGRPSKIARLIES